MEWSGGARDSLPNVCQLPSLQQLAAYVAFDWCAWSWNLVFLPLAESISNVATRFRGNKTKEMNYLSLDLGVISFVLFHQALKLEL